MWVRGDGRLVLVRACGLWHQGFAKEGVGDIDKYVSYNHVFDTLLFDKTQMDGKYCVGYVTVTGSIFFLQSIYHPSRFSGRNRVRC